MSKKIAVRDFRENLSAYLNAVGAEPGTVLQVGEKREGSDIVLMSSATFTQFVNRHIFNMSMNEGYNALNLHNFNTLSRGSKTTELPLDANIRLSTLFQFAKDVLKVLSRANLKTNAPNLYIGHEAFARTTDMVTKLTGAPDIQRCTLSELCMYLDSEDIVLNPAITSLPDDQLKMVKDIIALVGKFIYMMAKYQVAGVPADAVRGALEEIALWKQEYVEGDI